MERAETRVALMELARAAERLAELLGGEGEPPPAAGEEPAWHSPARDLEPVVVAGEEDLVNALERGHPVLVGEGAGWLVALGWSAGERLRHLATALVGDVALEAAHAAVQGSRGAVDGMLGRCYEVLGAAAADAGLPVPRAEFIAAATAFSELDSRGSEWR